MKNLRKPGSAKHHDNEKATVEDADINSSKTNRAKKARIARPVADEESPSMITKEKYDEYLEQLQVEFTKGKRGRNLATIKQIMKKTREIRWKWIRNDRPPVQDILKAFRSLASEITVSYHSVKPPDLQYIILKL